MLTFRVIADEKISYTFSVFDPIHFASSLQAVIRMQVS